MNRYLLLFLTGVSFFALTSCGSKKLATGSANVDNFRQLRKVLDERGDDYQWMTARIRMKIETPDQKHSGTAFLKMRNDSIIWVSISAGLGLEVLRAQITPDSIYVLDRFNRKYTVHPFSYVNRYFRAKELSFQNIENLLLGNPLFQIDRSYEMEADSSSIRLSNGNNVFTEFLSLLPALLKVDEFTLERSANRQKLTINYDEYLEVEEYVVPGMINIHALNPEPVSLSMNLSRVSFNQRENVNFGVPSNYERVQ